MLPNSSTTFHKFLQFLLVKCQLFNNNYYHLLFFLPMLPYNHQIIFSKEVFSYGKT